MAYATRTDLTTHGLSSAALGSISTTAQDGPRRRQRDGRLYLRTRYFHAGRGVRRRPHAGGVQPRRVGPPLRARVRPAARRGQALRLRAEDALRWLRDVSSGKAALSGITESESESWPEYIGAMSDESRGW